MFIKKKGILAGKKSEVDDILKKEEEKKEEKKEGADAAKDPNKKTLDRISKSNDSDPEMMDESVDIPAEKKEVKEDSSIAEGASI